jgi:hypothetical protein
MGGQACVFYGAAEFSRDMDFAVLATSQNLSRLRKAMNELQAEVIAVPPFEAKTCEKDMPSIFNVIILTPIACAWMS